MVNLASPVTQERFGELVGVSQQAVSDLVARGILQPEQSARAWLLAYCANLREQAAGRQASGDLALATERARLAKEQADRIAMANEERRRQLAPVELLELTLAGICRQIKGRLEALVPALKRRSALTAADLDFVAREVAEAANLAAAARLDWAEIDGLDEMGSGEPAAGAASAPVATDSQAITGIAAPAVRNPAS